MTPTRKCPVCGIEHPANPNALASLCSECWQSWFNRGGVAGDMLTKRHGTGLEAGILLATEDDIADALRAVDANPIKEPNP